jgi:exopolysaccharide biosynthesis protein
MFNKVLATVLSFSFIFTSFLFISPTDTYAATKKVVTKKKVVSPKVTVNNTLPTAPGYYRQNVKTDQGNFIVDIIAADMNSTRIIVDTASPSDCDNNCPALSLGEMAARSGAYAGINGSYFCPASYPSCASKKNDFDFLLMNKDKTYFNSDQNVFSTIPAVIFQSGSMRFVGASLEWGRDTSPDGVIANYPLLVAGGQQVYTGGSGDAKLNGRGPRSFVADKGNMAYIGFVNNATVAQDAKVLATLGVDNALHLDDGGSTALWFGGYKKGPGRPLASAVLFVAK